MPKMLYMAHFPKRRVSHGYNKICIRHTVQNKLHGLTAKIAQVVQLRATST